MRAVARGENLNKQRVLNALVSQNELRPSKLSGPCFFRSLQAVAEMKAGKNLTLEQIMQAGERLFNNKLIGQGDPDEFYYVDNPVAVIKDALTILGFPNAEVTYKDRFSEIPTDNPPDFTIRRVKKNGSHKQLGNPDGTLLWEPYDYNNPSNAYTGTTAEQYDLVWINLNN
ncbi:MAG: hypothetical protein GX297_04150 [Treponema sp.]|nr:hypothetical protein [Treponema sp.]